MSNNQWKKISSKYVFENPWYKVRQDAVIRPDNKEGTYNVIEKGQSVFIVPITDSKKILLIKLYRYATGHEGWEIPAGGVDINESLLEAAKRELQEETGCTSSSWANIGSFDSMNSITDSTSHIFVAEDVQSGSDDKQIEEGIVNVQGFSLSEVYDLIRSGEITDGLTIAALMKMIVVRGLIEKSI